MNSSTTHRPNVVTYERWSQHPAVVDIHPLPVREAVTTLLAAFDADLATGAVVVKQASISVSYDALAESTLPSGNSMRLCDFLNLTIKELSRITGERLRVAHVNNHSAFPELQYIIIPKLTLVN